MSTDLTTGHCQLRHLLWKEECPILANLQGLHEKIAQQGTWIYWSHDALQTTGKISRTAEDR